MREKLQSTRGETLVEALAAILICALSVALLFSAVMASARMDRLAQGTLISSRPRRGPRRR